jgi:hypothetical protein
MALGVDLRVRQDNKLAIAGPPRANSIGLQAMGFTAAPRERTRGMSAAL